MNKPRETYRLNQKADRAAMRANALSYRSSIAADYHCDLSTKVRWGVEFLRAAIYSRNQSHRRDWYCEPA